MAPGDDVPFIEEYCNGPLRRVTTAKNQAEAEMIQGLLRAEGIPCVVKRSIGVDVPDFLAAGWRDLMVPESGLAAARDQLQLPADPDPISGPSPIKLALAILAGIALILVLALALSSTHGYAAS